MHTEIATSIKLQNSNTYNSRLLKIMYPIMKEINFPSIEKIQLHFSAPIDPTMAYACGFSVNVCPLFVLELSEIPLEIRPQNWDDPRLCDLNFLQKLSDWIANEFHLPKQKVSFLEAAAVKTIIKLKQDPQGVKALRAGIVHELGHIALGHVFSH
jgi:NAD-dependent dihydropyrimidine dehydrogenase PreA subunit